jgi:hypothetical protein
VVKINEVWSDVLWLPLNWDRADVPSKEEAPMTGGQSEAGDKVGLTTKLNSRPTRKGA